MNLKPLSARTIERARWLRDWCRDCPHDQALNVSMSKNDCEAIAAALDFAILTSAHRLKPARVTK